MKLAAHVLRRHRLIELFLVEVLRLDWTQVHEEAERLEHAVSDRLIARIDEMLGFPAVDPHGDPIPDASGAVAPSVHPTLIDCELRRPVVVVRVSDQTPDFLSLLERSGLRPGSELQEVRRDEIADAVVLRSGAEGVNEDLQLGFRAAAKVQVRVL